MTVVETGTIWCSISSCNKANKVAFFNLASHCLASSVASVTNSPSLVSLSQAVKPMWNTVWIKKDFVLDPLIS